MTPEFKDHFSERAAGYAAYRPHYPSALAARLAELAPAHGTAWDAGCGSGQLSALLGDQFQRVIATDASDAQIARAVPHPRVEYHVELAESTSIARASIDLITVAQAAHWFNLPAFYREARRVARPGAAIALVAYGRTELEPPVGAVVDDFYSRILGRWWPAERGHIESGYRQLDFPFSDLEQAEIEMEVSWDIDQLLGYIGTWSAVRAMEAAEGGMATREFITRLRVAWGSVGRRGVRWPLRIRAGRIS